MKPQSGNWIGTFLVLRGQATQVAADLQVSDNGSITGHLTTEPGSATGPHDQTVSNSRYTPFGSIHLEYRSSDSDSATFDGRFEAPDNQTGVIWATGIAHQGKRTVSGTLALLFSGTDLIPDRGVWGGG